VGKRRRRGEHSVDEDESDVVKRRRRGEHWHAEEGRRA
jgi:hypothetical protein